MDTGWINGSFIYLNITKVRIHKNLNSLGNRRIKDFGRINGSDINLNIAYILVTTLDT